MDNIIQHEGLKVFVYFNLHKKMFSVRNLKTNLVIAHVNQISLSNALFKVSEVGRQRVLRERVKNVHAGVVGFISLKDLECPKQATYNPYKYTGFVNKDSLEVLSNADYVKMSTQLGGKTTISYQ